MRLSEVTEIFFASLLHGWQEKAPDDKRYGVLESGGRTQNSQQLRMAHALKIISVRWEKKYFSKLTLEWRKNDGRSYISKDKSGMESPIYLNEGWWLDGCASLDKKQELMQSFTKLGYSSAFVKCINSFIANKSLLEYFPTPEEEAAIMEKIKAQGEDA